MSSALETRLTSLRDELASLAPGTAPTLVAVSKTVGVDEIRRAHAAGQRDFGENRVQDLLAKMDGLDDLGDLRWHFIGRLQRNKIRRLVGRVALIHSIDSVRLAEAVDRVAGEEGVESVPVLLEVNVTGETSKTGFVAAELPTALSELLGLRRVAIRGLMTMAPFVDDETVVRSCFRALHDLGGRLAERFGIGNWLSMGMSNDYRVAVDEGATHVRIGTRIFHDEQG